MSEETLNLEPDSDTQISEATPKSIDLSELAEKIAALLQRELSFESERTGR
jgi:hypothetical protein